MWNALLLNQRLRRRNSFKSATKFRVFSVKPAKSGDNGVVNRLEDLLKPDLTPITDKIIAEYIWY
ncbi:hypothetical protein AMTR_s00025p00128750 [Amborella trichopoda]|uniref:Uncharacterized protein n=1 Tax=Amborella trichopoda TaxID=13333 RepID=W1PX49_AMBTC|nr:hypothetical protein AMTR_s00025p00128750 [Amborella trichopoda]